MTPLESLRAFLETIPREFLVAMADTAEREDRIEILERENERLRRTADFVRQLRAVVGCEEETT